MEWIKVDNRYYTADELLKLAHNRQIILTYEIEDWCYKNSTDNGWKYL